MLTALIVLVSGLGCDVLESDPASEPEFVRGAIVSSERMQELDNGTLRAQLAVVGLEPEVSSSLLYQRVVYDTIDPFGEPTTASGVVVYPAESTRPLSVISYQHGTLVRKREAPSAFGLELVMGSLFGASGFVCILPDYLGLGESPGFHPYVHAASEASAVVDMLKAGLSFLEDEGVLLDGDLYLFGYSQGGHATAAAQRALEADPIEGLALKASAPSAGPYDLSGTMTEAFTSDDTHPNPYYLPYALFTFDQVYRLYDSPSAYLVSPYDQELPGLFDGTYSAEQINRAMPERPSDILREDLIEAIRVDADHPLIAASRDNDLYRWTPQTPTRLYHCSSDDQVPYANATVAMDAFSARGAPVELIDPFPDGTHTSCFLPTLTSVRDWFMALDRPISAEPFMETAE